MGEHSEHLDNPAAPAEDDGEATQTVAMPVDDGDQADAAEGDQAGDTAADEAEATPGQPTE